MGNRVWGYVRVWSVVFCWEEEEVTNVEMKFEI